MSHYPQDSFHYFNSKNKWLICWRLFFPFKLGFSFIFFFHFFFLSFFLSHLSFFLFYTDDRGEFYIALVNIKWHISAELEIIKSIQWWGVSSTEWITSSSPLLLVYKSMIFDNMNTRQRIWRPFFVAAIHGTVWTTFEPLSFNPSVFQSLNPRSSLGARFKWHFPESSW